VIGHADRLPSGGMSTREAHLVELVDEAGEPTGAATVGQAHTMPGLLHRAFSVLLVDPLGRLLLQRRAAAKTRFALRWANACCGHPLPGQPVGEAALRRLAEELGLTGVALREVGVHTYRAGDPGSDRVEHEYDHVLVGEVPDEMALRPDPAEVDSVALVGLDELGAAIAAEPGSYAPWLAGVISIWHESAQRDPVQRGGRPGAD
jgi:isopentenyl-diphosphate delta-isomerase